MFADIKGSVSASNWTANEDQHQASSTSPAAAFFLPEHRRSPPSSQPPPPHYTILCPPAARRPTPNNNNNNNNNMPPRNPNTMPEFKLIDGWHVAVSQPVHNPADAAIERHFATVSAATLPGEMQYYSSPAGPAPAVSTRALGVKKLSTAAVEKDGSGVVRDGSYVQQFRPETVGGHDWLRCVRME